MLVVSQAITGSILVHHGTEEQKERWLRGIAAGTTRVAFAITEPDAGTNSHNLRTEVRLEGDRYLLSGQKVFISAVEDADAVLVVARLRGPNGSLGRLCMCIVDADAHGFTREVIPMPFLGPDRQWQLFFDRVELEPERLIGGEQQDDAGPAQSGEAGRPAGGTPPGLAALFDGANPQRIILARFADAAATLPTV